MNRTIAAIFAFALVGAAPLIALDGTIVTVTGKVESQDVNGAWKTLKAGDVIASGSMISTGFKSEATVKLGASILTVKPLTRMTLTQLEEKQDTVNTELYLEVGTVKAEVNSLNNKKNGFTVKSPAATASVRGTVFQIGEYLVVFEGNVALTNPIGQQRNGTAGQQLNIVGNTIASAAVAMQNDSGVIQLTTLPSTEVSSPILATLAANAPAKPDVTAASAAASASTVATLALTLE